MKIKSIRIVDFRGIEDRTFNFDDRFNVLIGENGKGKTSVLEALAAALNPYVSIGLGRNVRPIRKEDVRLIHFGVSKESKIKTGISVVGEIDAKKIEWSINKAHFDFGFMTGDDKTIKSIAINQFEALGNDGGVNAILPVFDYLGCGRLFSEPSKKSKTVPKGSRYEGYEDCLDSTSSIKRFASWFKTMELSSLQGDELAKWSKKVVVDAVSKCLEGWDSIEYDIREDELVAVKFIISDVEGEKQKLPFSYLSDGQRNIIGMVADIAYRCALLNPYLKEDAAIKSPGVVLIDELDLHLHPNWQKTIVENLKKAFPNLQFITTTHSPFIVQSLKNEELIDLEGKRIVDDYRKMGIEDIAEAEMRVLQANRSERFIEMKKVADEYFWLLQEGEQTTDKPKIEEIKAKLEQLMIPFYDDPAYVSYLQMFKYPLDKK
jgi:predicted ATP-binding protein involved in virulence